MAIITQTFGEKIQAKTSIYIFDISDFYLADQNPSTMLLEKRWWSISKIDSLVPIFLYYSRLVGRQIHEIGGGSLTDSLTLFQSFSTDKLSAEDGVEQKKHLYISPLLPTKTWGQKRKTSLASQSSFKPSEAEGDSMTRQNVAILSSLLLLSSTRAHSHTNSPAAKKKCCHQYRQPPTHIAQKWDHRPSHFHRSAIVSAGRSAQMSCGQSTIE